MAEMDKIFKALNKSINTQLSKDYIALNTTEKLVDKMKSTMGKELDEYENIKDSLDKKTKSISSKWGKLSADIKKEWDKISKMAQELGVPENDIPNFKRMTDLYFYIDEQVKKIK